MADYAAIRTGIANNVKNALPDIQTSAYMLSSPTPTTLHVKSGQTDFDKTFGRGLDEIVMTAQLFVPMVSDMASQITLDQYVAGSGSLSVKAAIETDRTLAGSVFDVWVSSVSQPYLYKNPMGTTMIAVDFTLVIRAHG